MPDDYYVGSIFYTESAALADDMIRRHFDCAYADYESITFYCYSCNAGIKWIG